MSKHIYILLIFISKLSLSQVYTDKDIKTAYINCLDNKLYYEEVGQGEPLVLAHGGFLDCRMWDEQFLYFANKGFRVIRFDSYAHGKTIDGKQTPFLHELVKTLLDSLSIDKANLVGLSMGGVTLIEFALEHPEYIDKMVLVSTGINGYNWARDKLFMKNLQQQRKYTDKNDTANIAEMFLRSWTDGQRQANEVSKEIRGKNKQMILERYTTHGIRKNALNSSPKAIKRIQEIKAPTLILLGELDMLSIHEISKKIHKEASNTSLVTIPDVAHMINQENPTEFNKVVFDFLK